MNWAKSDTRLQLLIRISVKFLTISNVTLYTMVTKDNIQVEGNSEQNSKNFGKNILNLKTKCSTKDLPSDLMALTRASPSLTLVSTSLFTFFLPPTNSSQRCGITLSGNTSATHERAWDKKEDIFDNNSSTLSYNFGFAFKTRAQFHRATQNNCKHNNRLVTSKGELLIV